MDEKIIYISGPISGLPLKEAIENFSRVEKMLRKKSAYADVINPFNIAHKYTLRDWERAINNKRLFEKMYKETLIEDLGELIMYCTEIYMMKNWGSSKGARLEYVIAKELGLKITYEK